MPVPMSRVTSTRRSPSTAPTSTRSVPRRWLWTIDNPNCTFADPTAAATTVTCTTVGTFAATLTADDGVGHPLVHDTAQVTSTSPNQPPVVNAGANVNGQINDDINLNATVTDADSPTVDTLWTVDSTDCDFGDDTEIDTTINCSVAGTYAATITADDGINPPVSRQHDGHGDEPAARSERVGRTRRLGQHQHPDRRNRKRHRPRLHAHARVDLGRRDVLVRRPDRGRDHDHVHGPGCVRRDPRRVPDGFHPDAFDTALVSVSQPNLPPVVNAGPNVVTGVNIAAALHGVVTDSDSSPTIMWTSDDPSCVFGNVNLADTTITCPAVGVVAATLTAHDTSGINVSDTALVTVSGNAPPTADAGPDVMTGVNIPAPLNGVVTDPDDVPTAYWSTASPNCTFGNQNVAVTTITCSAGGVYAATLTASDGVNAPVVDTALVKVNAPNTAPTVYAGPDQTDVVGHPVPLPGIVTDPDSIPTLQWANGSGHCVFGNPNVAVTTITCDTEGIYAATLTADDGVNPPVSDTAIITLTQPTCVGICLAIGDSVGYEGSALSLAVSLSTVQAADVTVVATIVPIPGGADNTFGQPRGTIGDYKSNPVHNLKIRAGARTAYFATKTFTDDLTESPESFSVVLSSPSGVPGVSIGRTTGTATILDATGAPDGTLLVGNSSIVEGDACAKCKFTVKVPVVMAGPKASATIQYSTVGTGGATPDDFKEKLNRTLTFTASGSTAKSLSVMVIGDDTPETGEGIDFVFSSPTGAITAVPPNGHIDILDNE